LTPEEYVANFSRGHALLERNGMEPRNPLTVQACPTEDCNEYAQKPDGTYLHSWQCYLKYDLIMMMMECDSIALLPNWNHSKGSKLELHVARELDYPILYISRGYKTVTKGVGI